MKSSTRLMLSAALTLAVHLGLLLNAGQPAANAVAHQVSSLMQFNLISSAHAEPFMTKKIQPIKTPKSEPKPSSKSKKIKLEPEIKKALPPKQNMAQPTQLKNKEPVREPQKVVKENASPSSQIKKTDVTSVTRDKNAVYLQSPRFKSLPPAPVYPRQARLRRQQGTALIHAQLNAQGQVIKTRLAKSSGYALLDKAAQKAITGWDFLPGTDSHGNSQVWVEVPVKFVLNPGKVS